MSNQTIYNNESIHAKQSEQSMEKIRITTLSKAIRSIKVIDMSMSQKI